MTTTRKRGVRACLTTGLRHRPTSMVQWKGLRRGGGWHCAGVGEASSRRGGVGRTCSRRGNGEGRRAGGIGAAPIDTSTRGVSFPRWLPHSPQTQSTHHLWKPDLGGVPWNRKAAEMQLSRENPGALGSQWTKASFPSWVVTSNMSGVPEAYWGRFPVSLPICWENLKSEEASAARAYF